MFADLRFASRQLVKAPAFAAAVIVTLALGIGVCTAMFSVMDRLLLQTLPVKNPDELVLLRAIHGAKGNTMRAAERSAAPNPLSSLTSFSLLAFERLRSHPSALREVFAYAPVYNATVQIDGIAEAAGTAQLVSGNYYAGLAVTAAIGRTLGPEDDQPAAIPVAVISHRYWQQRFHGDPTVLGRTLYLNQLPLTIVGVTPAGFTGALQVGDHAEISVPLAHFARLQPDRVDRAQPWYWWLRIMGRLSPGATAAQAQASLEPVFQAAALEGWRIGQSANARVPEEIPDLPTLAADAGARGENDSRRQHARALQILMGLASLVLLSACANVANLLLARGAARRREIALRLALGASRLRVIRQLFAEALLLAFLSAALGVVFALWAGDLLIELLPLGPHPIVLDLPLNARVLAFTLGATAATVLLCGLAPAVRATRFNLSAEFQGGALALGGRRSWLSRGLIVLQIALSAVLLVSTGLFIRTLHHLAQVDLGFSAHGLALFRIDPVSAGYLPEQCAALKTRLLERLATLPGVEHVTFSESPLLSGVHSTRTLSIPGFTPPRGVSMRVFTNAISPDFFATMELPVRQGRSFDPRDDAAAPKVAIVNETFVRSYFPGENPLGHTFSWGPSGRGDRIEIVGVVRDAKYHELRGAMPATVFTPALQQPGSSANFALRTSGDVGAAFPAIVAAVREVAPRLPVLQLRTQQQQIDLLNAEPRLFARLSGIFGVITVTLAGIGLYGLLSYHVVLRTSEIGVRVALGASTAQVLRMIAGESLGLIAAGLLLGLAIALAAGQLVASMLFGLSPADPATYGMVALALLLVAMGATLLPARRATRINPLTALRAE